MEKGELTFFTIPFFPLKKQKSFRFLYRSYVGIGGNQHNTLRVFQKVIRKWQDDRRLRVVQTSPVLKNPPFGYLNQPDFYNAVILIETSLTPQEFLKVLLHEETRFKRVRSFKNAPRALDLDIIMFDSFKFHSTKLTLPHPHWKKRVSVRAPLFAMGEK